MTITCPTCGKKFKSFTEYLRANHLRCIALQQAMRKGGKK